MTKQKVEIELDVPEGWKVAGYGKPKRGDLYLDVSGSVYKADYDGSFSRFILERVDRVPTYDDLHAARMVGDKVWVQARDKDDVNVLWSDPKELLAVLDGDEYPFVARISDQGSYHYCFARIVAGPDVITCKDGGK